jgi:tyrosyl-tRNA synthetase
VLLVGGATGLIGDPDGKSEERSLKTPEEIAANKQAIIAQYHRIFGDSNLKVVDNYDWFKGMNYLDFLRDTGKHVPLRQMLARDFVQSRLGETGSGISYAEFSYVLIQAYDYLRLYEDHGVTLQVAGSDQWGNSIAGVDLIRRKTGGEAHVFSAPLLVNKATGSKFGKTEAGAIWLDPAKTTPTQFYQFWINSDDADIESYLKVFTELNKDEVDEIMNAQRTAPENRSAQHRLASEVTMLVHGEEKAELAQRVTDVLVDSLGALQTVSKEVVDELRNEIPYVKASEQGSIVEALVESRLVESNTDARRLLKSNAISVNGTKVDREQFTANDFQDGRLLLRRGKAFKDSALVELG